MEQLGLSVSSAPSNSKVVTLLTMAMWMVWICWATTDKTSISIRLNSSKQAWKNQQIFVFDDRHYRSWRAWWKQRWPSTVDVNWEKCSGRRLFMTYSVVKNEFESNLFIFTFQNYFWHTHFLGVFIKNVRLI